MTILNLIVLAAAIEQAVADGAHGAVVTRGTDTGLPLPAGAPDPARRGEGQKAE